MDIFKLIYIVKNDYYFLLTAQTILDNDGGSYWGGSDRAPLTSTIFPLNSWAHSSPGPLTFLKLFLIVSVLVDCPWPGTTLRQHWKFLFRLWFFRFIFGGDKKTILFSISLFFTPIGFVKVVNKKGKERGKNMWDGKCFINLLINGLCCSRLLCDWIRRGKFCCKVSFEVYLLRWAMNPWNLTDTGKYSCEKGLSSFALFSLTQYI